MTDVLKHAPTELPPTDTSASTVSSAAGAPTLVAPASAEAAANIDTGPTLSAPPTAATTGGITAATWRSGTVTALWSIDEVRNAYMHVSGVGWKKLFNGRDGAYTALLILASQARQTGRTIQFREEADGMVYEIYLW